MAARTGHGDTPIRRVRMDEALWRALGERAEAEGLTASEVLRKLAARYVDGKIKAS